MTDPGEPVAAERGAGPRPYPGPLHGASARPRRTPARRAARAGRRALARGGGALVHGTGVAGRVTYRATHRATHAEGAGETGLARLIEIHGLHNAGDAVVAIALAGTLFFQVPAGQARGQVLLFLLLTMLPFSVIAPVVGPFLDRVRHGRRWAIGTTLALRALLALSLSFALAAGSTSWWQFPAALLVLIASKAYNVTRSAAAPRLLPEGMTLVRANARLSLAGVVTAAVLAPLGVAAAALGPEWALRLAFLIFTGGTVLAILLPERVDSARGERQVSLGAVAGRGRWRGLPGPAVPVPGEVVLALRANAGLRMLSGFLTVYLAFLLRTAPLPGWEGRFTLLLAVLAAAAGLGSGLGSVLGSRLRTVPPLRLATAVLALDVAVAVVAAAVPVLLTLVLLALTAGACQQLGKLGLDALIQDQVAEDRRTSVFGRSETLIQLSWVLGGTLGVALPTVASLGLGVMAGVLAGWLVLVLVGTRRRAGT